MQNVFEDLKSIGLSSGEIKVYNALLELGECKRVTLARKSGISPSKIYDVVNRLVDKGIVSTVKKQGTIHFSPANPKRIKDFINKKIKDAEEEKRLVDKILPDLIMQYNTKKEDIDIEVYYGWDGFETACKIIEGAVGKKDEVLIFGASKGGNPEQYDIFFKAHQKRVDATGCKIRIIFNEDIRERKERYEFYIGNKKHKHRFLLHETLTEINVYGEYVLLTLLLNKPVGILIKSDEAVDAFTKFFNNMWKHAKA